MESRMTKRKRRWDDRKSDKNVEYNWGRKTDAFTI